MTQLARPDLDSLDLLVAAAAGGDAQAWERLVRRLMPVVVSVIGEFGLDSADAAEINQTVWLRVVEWLTHIRQPAALPSWIATTTRRECERVRRTSRRLQPVGLYDDLIGRCADGPDPSLEDAAVREEQYSVLREGFAQLPLRCRELLTMLLDDPPMSYRDIGARTGMRIGSVGPTHMRCLDKLRATPAVAAYLAPRRENPR
jgi:RNA polymerase sigma factor (sigma-70 family)